MNWDSLGGDPVPGDPEAVRIIGRRLAQVALDTEDASWRLHALTDQEGDAPWVGIGADAFREQLKEILPDLAKLSRSHDAAGAALADYAFALQSAQDTARRALTDADDAVAREQDAHRDHDRAEQDRATGAAVVTASTLALTAINQALADLAAAPDPARAAQLHADQHTQKVRHDAAAARVHEAITRRTLADDEVRHSRALLAAARQLADDARDVRENAGRIAVVRLHDASEAGIHNKSAVERFFDSAVDTVKKVTASEAFRNFVEDLSKFGHILVDVGMVVGLFFPQVGAVLAAAGAILLTAAFVCKLVAFSVGNESGKEVFWSGVNAGLAIVGAHHMSKLAGSGVNQYQELGGELKRSLSYQDNRHLSGLGRKLLWEPFTAGEKLPLPERFFRLEEPLYQLKTGYDFFDAGEHLRGAGEHVVELGEWIVEETKDR